MGDCETMMNDNVWPEPMFPPSSLTPEQANVVAYLANQIFSQPTYTGPCGLRDMIEPQERVWEWNTV